MLIISIMIRFRTHTKDQIIIVTFILRLADSKIVVMDKLYLYARMADRIMKRCLPIVESSFTRVVACEFRTILSQEDLPVERVSDTASDDDDSLCMV